ncbi:unnamed protein product [Clavelina lepadiformis]|uniref:D-aspartate oxidase n=1 Tax=Clavelina lepadiformis TaxID=159417 RepID=A0ABP0F473_CLALP
MVLNIAVIGAGISGLSTALKIMQDIPNRKVTIFFDQCTPNTTGNVAAGFIYPIPCGRPDPTDDDAKRLCRYFEQTMDRLKDLHKRPDAYKLGITPVSGYILGFDVPDYAARSLTDLRKIDRDTQASFMIPQEEGHTFTTWICDCNKYLPWLMQEIENMGGKFIQRRIENLDELKNFNLIVNCAGVHSNFLGKDEKIESHRGQVIVVKAPWINHFYIAPPETYIFPRMDDVILGGSLGIGNWSLKEDRDESKTIWQECLKLCPSLKYCDVKDVQVGLRPGRNSIRLEVEEVNIDGKCVPVLHNYGHGGGGITFHWGCAIEASELVQTYLKKAKACL